MSDAARYLTPPALARLWGVTAETVIAHIRAGRLRAFTISPPDCSRPRWRIAPDAVAEYELRHQAARPQTPQRRRKQPAGGVIEFF